MRFAFKLELMTFPIRLNRQTWQEGEEKIRFFVGLGAEQIILIAEAHFSLGKFLKRRQIFGLYADCLEFRADAAEHGFLACLLGKIQAQFLQLRPSLATPQAQAGGKQQPKGEQANSNHQFRPYHRRYHRHRIIMQNYLTQHKGFG